MTSKNKEQWAKMLLTEKAQKLGRIPQKADFDEATRSRIKAFLGPWPRALEAAGLKEPKLSGKKRKEASKTYYSDKISGNGGDKGGK